MKTRSGSIQVGLRAEGALSRPAEQAKRGALVVDDDEDLRAILRITLLAEGFECETAASGREALACLAGNMGRKGGNTAFDLILVDIVMPGMDGLELTSRIRRDNERSAIVIVTGVDDASRAREALRLGADEYLVKPYSISQLRLAWEQALERRRQVDERKRAARARDELTDLIFHDLRNPLSVTRGYLSLMGAAPGAIGPRDIRAAAQGCDLAIDIIEQGEEFGRIERSGTAVKQERLHLDEVLLAVVKSLRPLAEGAGKRIRAACADDLPAAVGDARLVKRIISDLIAGAVKYASGETDVLVELSASRDRSEVLLAVTDDGLTVPRGLHEAIFDKRRQGELNRAGSRRGRALALPFAREACRRMGGRIWVEDAQLAATRSTGEKNGCRFVVAFRAASMDRTLPVLRTSLHQGSEVHQKKTSIAVDARPACSTSGCSPERSVAP